MEFIRQTSVNLLMIEYEYKPDNYKYPIVAPHHTTVDHSTPHLATFIFFGVGALFIFLFFFFKFMRLYI